MVKIKLLDEPIEEDKSEGFLKLVPHLEGYALVITDRAGDEVSAPYVLFLEPDLETGKITLSLASCVNEDYVERGNTAHGTIRVNVSH
ncbi:hypothetical protein LCGC14_2243200 [marine sediment metagenome]|uniref:Uncharacterized protein n=1 Tax=marine sediment metagenome TaxID=412755 RepID=A0A0F9DSF1_9ZZZZ